MSDAVQALEALVTRLVDAGWKERDGIKDELFTAASDLDYSSVVEFFEERKKTLKLELRWEIDEVLETLAPPPPEEPDEEEAEEEDDPNRPLTAADLAMVYDDPRGFALHKSKKGNRWFATQRDPRTGQPQTFELQPQEIANLKQQLDGSPYWVLGAGGAAS